MDVRDLFVAGASLFAVGCVASDPIDRNIERLVTIDTGVYGQGTTYDDVGDGATRYLSGFQLDVYARPAGAMLGTPVVSATTEASRAFYQAALPPGGYVICTTFARCVSFDVVAGQRLRLDYEVGPGPGWSTGEPWPR